MSSTSYVPPSSGSGDWATRPAAQAGFDADKLKEAIAFAEASESSWPRDLEDSGSVPGLTQIEPAPWNAFLGPLKPRGGPSGLILRHGEIVASWGDPGRVDMTFSIAKSYLSVLCGIAVDDGLIGSIDDPVRATVDLAEFSGDHNGAITWRHLLTQTSEWSGTLFDKPDQVDHYREVGAGSTNADKGKKRPLQSPGTFWEYNDVRVNVFSLALLHVFRRPLPDVLRERIMDPIGASDKWSWHGYYNSEVMVDGTSMISVPGGTHWGGGMWIDSFDHARFGLLIAQGGTWDGKRLLSEDWVRQLQTPIDIYTVYGFLWWLNTGRAYYPSAPATSFFALGAGSNLIWIDPALDIVGVFRWIEQSEIDPLLGHVMDAFKG
ncbi:MAG: serine hydrolase [Rhodospirillales bacterium]